MEIVGILNQKGGVAKTTTASALAYGLAERKYKVLVVDIDAQCNLTDLFGFNPDEVEVSIYNVMKGENDITESIVHTRYDNIDLLPGSPELATLHIALYEKMQREFILSKCLKKIKGKYDFVIIDTPPTLGIATINVLVAVNRVIIPSEAEMFSLKGMKFLYERIEIIREFHDIDITGILLTRLERTSNDRLVVENSKILADGFNTIVFDTKIRAQKNVKESRMRSMNVIEYSAATRKKGKEDVGSDYEKFVDEFLKVLAEKKEK